MDFNDSLPIYVQISVGKLELGEKLPSVGICQRVKSKSKDYTEKL